jgi:hypothetical protein
MRPGVARSIEYLRKQVLERLERPDRLVTFERRPFYWELQRRKFINEIEEHEPLVYIICHQATVELQYPEGSAAFLYYHRKESFRDCDLFAVKHINEVDCWHNVVPEWAEEWQDGDQRACEHCRVWPPLCSYLESQYFDCDMHGRDVEELEDIELGNASGLALGR